VCTAEPRSVRLPSASTNSLSLWNSEKPPWPFSALQPGARRSTSQRNAGRITSSISLKRICGSVSPPRRLLTFRRRAASPRNMSANIRECARPFRGCSASEEQRRTTSCDSRPGLASSDGALRDTKCVPCVPAGRPTWTRWNVQVHVEPVMNVVRPSNSSAASPQPLHGCPGCVRTGPLVSTNSDTEWAS
jgi:hypothetical protein